MLHMKFDCNSEKKNVCNPIRATLLDRSKVSHDLFDTNCRNSTEIDLASNVRNLLGYFARPRVIEDL